MRTLLTFFKILIFIVGAAVIAGIHMLYFMITQRLTLTMWFHRYCCWVFGIKIKEFGERIDFHGERPVLYAANHISYLDILVLGSRLDASFVSKSEVATWPGFGFLSKLQKTIFIERKRSALGPARAAIRGMMKKGHNVILFPEGTSTSGASVIQFRAALFSTVMDNEVPDETMQGPIDPPLRAIVQPVAIVVKAIDGQTVKGRQDLRDVYAWYAEMALAPHLWTFGKIRRMDVDLHYLPPLDPAHYADRKDVANTAQAGVSALVAAAS